MVRGSQPDVELQDTTCICEHHIDAKSRNMPGQRYPGKDLKKARPVVGRY